jgi:pantetheine-phosphate adenylyltransferase
VKVLLGGTFSVLHKAHKKMIIEGAKLGELYIGITSDKFAGTKSYTVPPYEDRRKGVESFLRENRIRGVIRMLNDRYGASLDEMFDAIVVSNETFDLSSEINFIRKSRGIHPLKVSNIGTVLAEDLIPIKSERIIKGQIDENGKRLRKIKIVLLSRNKEKIKGTQSFFKRLFEDRFELETRGADYGIPVQPMGDEIIRGAMERTKNIAGDYDYVVGLEAGIVSHSGRNFDVHFAAVKDSTGRQSFGISSGLFINNRMMMDIKNGDELEEVIDRILGLSNSGEEKGAVYYLSRGLKERKDLVEEALLSAFTERLGDSIPWNLI